MTIDWAIYLKYEAQLTPCPVCKGTDIGLYGPCEAEPGKFVWDVFCDEGYHPPHWTECAYVAGYATPEEAVAAWNSRENMYNI